LSGIIYPVLAKYEQAVEESRRAVELDPENAIGYVLLAASYEYLDRGEPSRAIELSQIRHYL
jgi:eukaryotic-like serine/threonine-protein kinase